MNIKISVQSKPDSNIDFYDSNTSLFILSEDFLEFDNHLMKRLKKSIENKVSSIYLVGKNSEKIKEECDGLIVNKWMENTSDNSYFNIFIAYENDIKESFEQSIFNFLSININNKIEKLFIYLPSSKKTPGNIDLINKELKRLNDIWGISYSLNTKFN